MRSPWDAASCGHRKAAWSKGLSARLHVGSPLPAPVLQPWAPQESNRLLLGWWSSTEVEQSRGGRERVGKVQATGSFGKESQPQQGPWLEGTH